MLPIGGKLRTISSDQHPHVGEDADDPHDSQQPDESQESCVLSQSRHEGGRDDHEVEHIPPVAEEGLGPASVGSDPDCELHHEDGQTGVVRGHQQVTDPIVHGVVGLKPEDYRVEDDDAEDERLKAPRVGDPPAALGHSAQRMSQALSHGRSTAFVRVGLRGTRA